MSSTRRAVSAIRTLLQLVPARHRAHIYTAIVALGAVSTLVVLAIPHSDLVGIAVPDRWAALATGAATLLGALARANTDERD